jgi:hypothetical protein
MTTPDPFWSEVRRLLPDVDIVLIPPEPEPPPASGSRFVTAIRARRVREDARTALGAAWTRLLPALDPPPTVLRTWRAAGDSGRLLRVELVARRPGAPPAGVLESVAAARAELTRPGEPPWPLDERPWATADPRKLVTATAGFEIELYGARTPPALTLTVRGPALPVPPDLARDLLATATEELPW